jgi:hypothetical protein
MTYGCGQRFRGEILRLQVPRVEYQNGVWPVPSGARDLAIVNDVLLTIIVAYLAGEAVRVRDLGLAKT